MGQPAVIEIPSGLCSSSAYFKGVCPDAYKDWFRVENAATTDGEAPIDLVIDGVIVDGDMADMLGIGVSASNIVQTIMEQRGRPLNVWINSEGGLIQDGLGIYNQLLMHDAPVTTIVYGFAMSIASVIAMAGSTRIMAPASALFIHEGRGPLYGTASDHRQEAENLDRLSEQIASVYRARGDSRRNWRAMMQAGSGPAQGTFILADEAVKLGLASRIDTDIVRKPSNLVDLGRFGLSESLAGRTNLADVAAIGDAGEPVDIQDEQNPDDEAKDALVLTVRDVERSLRDGGLSQSQAKMAAPKVLASLTQRDGARDESTETVDDTGLDIQALFAEGRRLMMLYGAPSAP